MSGYTPNLDGDYIFAGFVDYTGNTCDAAHLKEQIYDNWNVYAVDVSPGCYAAPVRFFVGTTGSNRQDSSHAAIEALMDMAVNQPDSRAFRELMEPADSDDNEDFFWIGGQRYKEREGAIIGVKRVTVEKYIREESFEAEKKRLEDEAWKAEMRLKGIEIR